MDIFMDKLSQRAAAQEIIRANTAADVEELNKLKNQITEYNDCLKKMKSLIDDGSARLAEMQAEDSGARNLVEEALEGIRTLQKTMEDFEQSQRRTAELVEGMDKSVVWQLELMTRSIDEKMSLPGALTEEQLTAKLSAVEENVHKECVKVYRNVQAVVTEEGKKQEEALKEAGEKTASMRRKIGLIVGFSAAAMAASLAGVLIQILTGLGLLSF